MQPSESDSGFERPARRRHVAPWDHDLLGGILAPFGGGAAGILIVNATVAHAQQAPELKPFPERHPNPAQAIRMINFAGGFKLPIWITQRQGFFAAEFFDVKIDFTPGSTYSSRT